MIEKEKTMTKQKNEDYSNNKEKCNRALGLKTNAPLQLFPTANECTTFVLAVQLRKQYSKQYFEFMDEGHRQFVGKMDELRNRAKNMKTELYNYLNKSRSPRNTSAYS